MAAVRTSEFTAQLRLCVVAGLRARVVEIDAGRVGLRATGRVMRFAGYLAIYAEAQDDVSPDDESTGSLPDIQPDETLRLLGCRPEQHFTQPPPHFSEATLVRELVLPEAPPPSDNHGICGTSLPRSLRAVRMRASNRVSVPLMGGCRANPSDVNSSTMAKGPTGEIEDKLAVNVPR